MRRILTSLVLVASAYSFAQVGISGNTSDTPKATLDVRAIGGTTPDGILIPKVDKDRAQSMTTPEDSTLAYIKNTGTGGDRTADVDADGFYYFKGSKWIKLGGDESTWGTSKMPSNGVVTITADKADIPDTAFFVIMNISTPASIKLPDASNMKNGRMLSIFKVNLNGNLTLLDKDGKKGGITGSQLVGDGTVRKASGRTYMVINGGWYPIAF